MGWKRKNFNIEIPITTDSEIFTLWAFRREAGGVIFGYRGKDVFYISFSFLFVSLSLSLSLFLSLLLSLFLLISLFLSLYLSRSLSHFLSVSLSPRERERGKKKGLSVISGILNFQEVLSISIQCVSLYKTSWTYDLPLLTVISCLGVIFDG